MRCLLGDRFFRFSSSFCCFAKSSKIFVFILIIYRHKTTSSKSSTIQHIAQKILFTIYSELFFFFRFAAKLFFFIFSTLSGFAAKYENALLVFAWELQRAVYLCRSVCEALFFRCQTISLASSIQNTAEN